VVSLDYSLIIQIVNFILLIFILNRILYRPLLGMLDQRKRQFADSEAEIKRLQETVDQKMAAYEEKLHQAKTAAVEEKKEIIRQGAQEVKAITDAVRAEIPALMDEFHSRLAGEMDAAKRILAGQSRKLSVEIAEKVLGRSLQ
jgi:F-type H+-transporting ATPase subunit b